MENRQWRTKKRQWKNGLSILPSIFSFPLAMIIGLVFAIIVRGGIPPLISAAERPVSPLVEEKKSQREERFLQHFVTRPLEESADTPPTADHQPPTLISSETMDQQSPVTSDLTLAATKMILALGILLGLLLAVAYLARRYFFNSALHTQRENQMQVLARVNITPKATIALVEVPGKVLVVGITGHTLTALGELENRGIAEQKDSGAEEERSEETEEQKNLEAVEGEASFGVTLDQHTRAFAMMKEGKDEAILQVTEAIQKKVSGLKKL